MSRRSKRRYETRDGLPPGFTALAVPAGAAAHVQAVPAAHVPGEHAGSAAALARAYDDYDYDDYGGYRSWRETKSKEAASRVIGGYPGQAGYAGHTSGGYAQARPANDDLPRLHVRYAKDLALTFSAAAWLKYKYLCLKADTEIAAMGVSRFSMTPESPDDLLYIEDIAVMAQSASAAFVSIDDDALADHVCNYVDQGYTPEQVCRIWLHTHPGGSASPSGTDETTFRDAFGTADWAIMGILARGGEVYARLRQVAKLGHYQQDLPVLVDWSSVGNSPFFDREWQKQMELELSRVRSHGWGGRGTGWGYSSPPPSTYTPPAGALPCTTETPSSTVLSNTPAHLVPSAYTVLESPRPDPTPPHDLTVDQLVADNPVLQAPTEPPTPSMSDATPATGL